MYEITSEIAPREGTIDPRLYRAAFAHAAAFRMAYTASRGQDDMRGSTRSDDGPTSLAQTRFDSGDGDSQKCVRVAVHIRRGDLTYATLRYATFRNRWIPNRAYIQAVDAVYKALSTPLDKEPHSRVRHHVDTQSPVPASKWRQAWMHDCWQAEAQKSWTSFASTRSGGKHGYGNEVEKCKSGCSEFL